MGHFQAVSDAVAVAADRLVAIVRVEPDGSVVVRDLANGRLQTTSASELSAPAVPAGFLDASLSSIALATEAQWERARRRESVVAAITDSTNLGQEVARAAAQLRVSDRTVYRWLAAYRALPQTSSSGTIRTSATSTGKSR